MKYLLLQSENEKKQTVLYAFAIDANWIANNLYKKIRKLPVLTDCVKDGWVNILDIPKHYLTLQEFEILNLIGKYKITGVILMTKYEYDLASTVRELVLVSKVKKHLSKIIKSHYKIVLENVRKKYEY